jgi:hypothetical protein
VFSGCRATSLSVTTILEDDDEDDDDDDVIPALRSETAALGAVVSVEQAAIPVTEAAQRAASIRFIVLLLGILRLTNLVDGTALKVKFARYSCDNRAIHKQTIGPVAHSNLGVFPVANALS